MRLLCGVLVSSLVSLALFGQDLDLSSAGKIFLEHNYDLKIAKQEAQKSYANLITAKERPNPLLTTSYEFLDLNKKFSDQARGSNAQATILLSHPIETANKRDWRIDVAQKSIEMNVFTYEEMVRQATISFILSYYEILKNQTDFHNALENAQRYGKVVAIAKAKLDKGFLSPLEYQKIALQHIEYTKEVETARLTLLNNREEFASLLVLPNSDFNVVEPLDPKMSLPSLEALLEHVDQRADCKVAKQFVLVSDASLNLEKANGVPNVSVGAEYASFGPLYEPLVGVNLSMPLPIYDKNEGDIEKARIAKIQAHALYDKTLRQAKTTLIQSYESVKSMQSLYEAMSEGFETAKELKEKQERVFSLKAISVLELLDAQKSYREYQKNLTHATVDLQSRLAILKLHGGLPLFELSKGHE